ncbi:MAG: TIGR03752 family integrating conjugative element protein [Gammaproteobacteria bacterium]|nr:TIGR03752 family integrating conjugative element protein [Gammaproteobacteria bacterium]
MNANLLVKGGVAVVLLVATAMVVVRCSRDEAASVGVAPAVGGEPLSPETAAALGIEGDTPDDIVRTLIANVRETNERLATIEDANRTLREENARLRGMRASVVAEVTRDLGDEAARLREENRGVVADARDEVLGLRSEIERLLRDAPIGGAAGREPGPDRAAETVWLRPMAAEAAEAGLLPWGEGPAGAIPIGKEGERDEAPPVRPVYTIPKNATLVGARAFTALIGRVPVGEEARVTDPYFFKLVVGRDNLAANGHEIPELAYAVASGEAIGDWTLGCVSGDVVSMTFVFADGRIVTVPEARDVSEGGAGTRAVRLGGLSDDHGNPCVAGERITNAASYLGQSAAALTLGAAAEGLAAAQTTAYANGVTGMGTTLVDGDVGRFAAGRGLSGAAQEVARWLRERQAQEFDAVYVAPGARVAVHVDEELRIDYDPAGRLVRHEDALTAGRHRALD